jgi:predicted nucleic acid-binding protein
MNHVKTIRLQRIKEVYLLMRKHDISVEEVEQFATTFKSTADLVQQRRDVKNAARRNKESLEKARAVRLAKKQELQNVQTLPPVW